MRRMLLALLVLAGCGDDGGDDACTAAADPSFNNGTCGADVQITGELVDWDNGETFCGVNQAAIAINGQTSNTAPNGRFILCAPDSPDSMLSVTLPTATSQCTVPASTYSTPTLIYLTNETIKAGATISARTFTDDRRTTFYTDVIGEPFDATKGHVLVHVDGPAVAISIDKDHGPSASIAGTTWARGDTGREVFFPNIEIGDGRATVSVASGCATASAVPLAAGQITNVTILTF